LQGLTFQAPIKAPRATRYNLSRDADGNIRNVNERCRRNTLRSLRPNACI
jgi:hypothetical protein